MKKSNVWKKTEWAGLICIFFILMILIRMLWNSGSDGEMADIRSVNSGWYQMVDGKEKALELPAMVKADQDGKIILYNNTLNPEDKNKVLSINGLQEQPEVWMGKKCLFRYEEKDFLKNDQMRGKMWADVWLTEDTGTEPFCFRKLSGSYTEAFPGICIFISYDPWNVGNGNCFCYCFLVYESPSYY